MQPKISIVLPVYNGGAYLASSVNSVLQQTRQDFELLIVDDHSRDNSFQFLCGLNDPRISLFRNEKNMGLFYNLNFLIKKAQAPLIKLWSHDDVMKPTSLEEIVKFHQQHPDLGFSYTAVSYIDAEGKAITKQEKADNTPSIVSKELHSKICFETGSIAGNIANVTITRKGLDTVGLFD